MRVVLSPLVLPLIGLPLVGAFALSPPFVSAPRAQSDRPIGTTGAADRAADRDDLADAREDLREAAALARQMGANPEARTLLGRSKGVFLVPDYGRGAAIVGSAGGDGVLVAKQPDGSWGNPVFYNIGSISIGAQAGVSAGHLAMLLMTDQAVNGFKAENAFSLDATAGLTIIDWSRRAEASTGSPDVVLWSDTEGAFAGISVGISSIAVDKDENETFYAHPAVTPNDILSGSVKTQSAEVAALKAAL